jgi:hypothetical protein
MDAATNAVTYDIDEWLRCYGKSDTYSRECARDARNIILANVDEVADAAITLVRILRPSALDRG